MGEKKMLQKERKSPSQKKEEKATAPAIPKPRPYISSFFHKAGHVFSYARARMIHERTISGSGVIGCEKKMLQKERKSPSQKKEEKAIAPTIPAESELYFSIPSFFGQDISFTRSRLFYESSSGSSAITKSWTPSPSPARRDRIHQTRSQQLVQTNVSPEERRYNVFERRVIEPFYGDGRKNESAEFINSITFQGKRYAISLQGCLALSVGRTPRNWQKEWGRCTDDLLEYDEITAIGRHRVVPYCKVSKHFREYLLEYDGDIYLVFLLSRASINVVDGVEVHRLDTLRLAWEKVVRLKGDAMFFVEEKRCLGISARELGCNSKWSNCVYYTHDRALGCWFVYDMETSWISPTSGPEID